MQSAYTTRRVLAAGPYPGAGAYFGAIAAVARAVGDGDDAAFHAEWNAEAHRRTCQCWRGDC